MAELNIDTSRKSFIKQLSESPISTIIASVLSTFIIAAIFFKLSGPVPISVTQTSVEKLATFDVTGEGSVSVVPDTAETSLGIQVSKSSVAAAQDEANKVINNISKALKDNGVEEKNIKTQNYSIYPEYNRREGSQITGYSVSANLRVKVTDFAKLNQAIDAAVKLGANQVSGITFSLSDKAQEEAENEARKEAVDKAKTKAESLAKAAGVRLGRIINIQEGQSYKPSPVLRTMEASMPSDEAVPEPTQVEPGSTEVNLSVTLSYETL